MVGRIVKAMESKNVVVRTGGLNGIDQVVMDNAREAELHIPFRNFNKLEAASQYSNEPCLELARRYLPELDTLPNVPKATFAKTHVWLWGVTFPPLLNSLLFGVRMDVSVLMKRPLVRVWLAM